MFACLHGQGNLTALAFEFSPTVERTGPDTVTFDVSGLDRLFGLPQDVAHAIARRASETQVAANLALAANPDAAIYAARGFAGVSLVPQGDEAKFLGPLPLAILGPTPDLAETLERWGIRRFQELAALPPLGIAERLGAEGLRLRELARGESDRKLLPIPEALTFEDEIELEYPVDLLEPLAFLLARLVNGLAMRLATRGLATDELRLRLKLAGTDGSVHAAQTARLGQGGTAQTARLGRAGTDGSVHAAQTARLGTDSSVPGTYGRTVRLPVPSLDTKAFLKLLQLDLSANPPQAPVEHIWMGVNPVKPQAAQSGLFVPSAPEPVKLELTLARIKSIVGQDRVGRPALRDTHGPGGPVAQVRGAPRQAFRHFRPPLAARVSLAETQPEYVAAGGIRGKVVDLAGPWRTSGDWWTLDAWQRDEWDIALSDGALYRLCCSPAGWFLEGSYD